MIESTIQNGTARVTLQGEFSKYIAKSDIESLQNLSKNPAIQRYEMNLDNITKFDLTFLIFLYQYRKNATQSGKKIAFLANSMIREI